MCNFAQNFMSKLIGLGLSVMILISCGGKTSQQLEGENSTHEETETISPRDKAKIEKMIYSIPSPVQAALLLEKTGARFDNKYMNDVSKVSSYQTTPQIALNIGIYGADLAYTNVYKKHVEGLKYFSVIQKLGDKIGIGYIFTPELMHRFEANQNNQDSLISITTDSFTEVHSHLKKNQQEELIALMLVGGWIEALYISCQIWENNPNKAIATLIAEQKFSLNDVMEVIRRSPKVPELDKIYKDLKELVAVFNQVKATYSYEKTELKKDRNLAVIENQTKLSYSNETIKKISKIISKIRNSIN
jgi:hypothetical protein